MKDWTINVAVHESAFPANVRERVLAELASRQLDPFFLYSGVRQTTNWIALHRELSPAHRDAQVLDLYQQAFVSLAEQARTNVVHVVSIGCGDGSKDLECLKLLREAGRAVLYSPCDISMEMSIAAQQTATTALRGLQCTPLVCDFRECSTFPGILKSLDPSGAERVVLFLGTVHNLEAREALRTILPTVRSQDWLVLGANLAPEMTYFDSLQQILKQYDNHPTRRWLLDALHQVGIEPEAGELVFQIQPVAGEPWSRIEAKFTFAQALQAETLGTVHGYSPGQTLSVFQSARFTRQMVHELLQSSGYLPIREWVAPNEEEGLWLCRRGNDH